MLRKNPTSETPSVRKRDLEGVGHDNDKDSKLRRHKDSQTKAIFFCLGIIALLGIIAKGRVNHLQKYAPKRLRKQNHRRMSVAHEENIKTPNMIDFLPPYSLYKLEVEDIHGKMVDFSSFRGMVTLIVNVACSWGKTRISYTELAELQKMYRSKGFSVLAFPISDFHQELGSNEEIISFVHEHFPQVDFPLFSLSSLDKSPVYQSIRKQKPDTHVKWNFYKFLVDWNGQVVKAYDKKVTPLQIVDQIEKLLDEASRAGGHKLVMS